MQQAGNYVAPQAPAGELLLSDEPFRTEIVYPHDGYLGRQTANVVYDAEALPGHTLNLTTEARRNGYDVIDPPLVGFRDTTGASYTLALGVEGAEGSIGNYVVYNPDPKDASRNGVTIFSLGDEKPEKVTFGEPLTFPGIELPTNGPITSVVMPKDSVPSSESPAVTVSNRPRDVENPLWKRRREAEQLAKDLEPPGRIENLDGHGSQLPDPVRHPLLLRTTPFSGGVKVRSTLPETRSFFKGADSLSATQELILMNGVNIGSAVGEKGVVVEFDVKKPDGTRARITVAQTPQEFDPAQGGEKLNTIGPLGKYLWQEAPLDDQGQVPEHIDPVRRYLDSGIDGLGVSPNMPLCFIGEKRTGFSDDDEHRPYLDWRQGVPRDTAYGSNVRPLLPPDTVVEKVAAYR